MNQCWLIVNGTPVNKFQWNLNQNSIIFIEGNAFENVICQYGSHLVQGEMGWHGFIIVSSNSCYPPPLASEHDGPGSSLGRTWAGPLSWGFRQCSGTCPAPHLRSYTTPSRYRTAPCPAAAGNHQCPPAWLVLPPSCQLCCRRWRSWPSPSAWWCPACDGREGRMTRGRPHWSTRWPRWRSGNSLRTTWQTAQCRLCPTGPTAREQDSLESPIQYQILFGCIYLRKCKNVLAFSIISQHWDGTGSWKPSSWTTRLSDTRSQDISTHGIRPSSPGIFWFQHHKGRADFRLAPSQWETSLQSNTISNWLGANLE